MTDTPTPARPEEAIARVRDFVYDGSQRWMTLTTADLRALLAYADALAQERDAIRKGMHLLNEEIDAVGHERDALRERLARAEEDETLIKQLGDDLSTAENALSELTTELIQTRSNLARAEHDTIAHVRSLAEQIRDRCEGEEHAGLDRLLKELPPVMADETPSEAWTRMLSRPDDSGVPLRINPDAINALRDAARRPDPTEGTPTPSPARLPGDAQG